MKSCKIRNYHASALYVLISIFVLVFFLDGCTNTENQTNNNIDTNTKVTTAERIVLEEVPDYISNRGIILRGTEGKYGLRMDVETTDLWYERYTTDCNLSLESTDEEFQEFVKNIFEEATISYYSNGDIYACIKKFKKSESANYYYYINKTTSFKEDLSDGSTLYYFEEGMSCGTPVFYDTSGKYLLDTACYSIDEEVILKFLEPVMTEVSVNSASFSDEEVIQSYIDAIHALEASLTDKKPEDVLNEDDAITVNFTSKEGKEFSYCFTNEEYLIYNDEVYEIGSYAVIKMLSENAKEEYVPE